MKQKAHFYRLARLSIISILHIVLSVVFVFTTEIALIHIVAAGFIAVNMLFLLRYFSATIELVMASRLEKRPRPAKYYTLFNVLLGILLNAVLIFILFVIMFNHIDALIAN